MGFWWALGLAVCVRCQGSGGIFLAISRRQDAQWLLLQQTLPSRSSPMADSTAQAPAPLGLVWRAAEWGCRQRPPEPDSTDRRVSHWMLGPQFRPDGPLPPAWGTQLPS